MPKISRTKEMIEMPANFTPGPTHVICAKGKQAKEHKANRLLRFLVQSNLQEYSECPSKLERSFIVSKILKTIRQDGGFVRQVNGKWYDVSDRNAREKIGQIFRDQLSWQFKSSTKAKASMRRQRAVTSSSISSSSSTSDSSITSHSESCSQQQQSQVTTALPAIAVPSFFPPISEVRFPSIENIVTPDFSCSKKQVQMDSEDFEPLPFATTSSSSLPVVKELSLLNDFEPLPLSQAMVMDFNMSGLTTTTTMSASDDYLFFGNDDEEEIAFDQAIDEFFQCNV